MPKVSIIIPCYNQAHFIEDALNSIYAQVYTDYEIIIVDDGSEDKGTAEKLDKFSGPKSIIVHTTNQGVSAARNTGILKSCGQYILPVDADDKIDKNYLKEAVEILALHPAIKMVCCNAAYFGEQKGRERLPDFSTKGILQQNLFFNSSMFRKEAFIEAGGYDEAFLTGWEDWDLYLRMIQTGEDVYHIEQPYYLHRIVKNSRNDSLQDEKLRKVEQQLFLKYISKYLNFYPNPISLIREHGYLLKEVNNFEKYKAELFNSLSYRLGHFILSPIKWVSKIAKGSM